MARILVVYASRHGATAGIADRIGEVLRREGNEVVVVDAVARPDPQGFDAYVVGSAVYLGSWLNEATDWLERHRSLLATRPVWLFSSGPLPGSTKESSADPLADALGPSDGPGSGGRKKIEAVSGSIRPREHAVFRGAFNPKDPPKSMSERMVRLMPAAKGILPAGDFREWPAIEAWAQTIASAVAATSAGALP